MSVIGCCFFLLQSFFICLPVHRTRSVSARVPTGPYHYICILRQFFFELNDGRCFWSPAYKLASFRTRTFADTMTMERTTRTRVAHGSGIFQIFLPLDDSCVFCGRDLQLPGVLFQTNFFCKSRESTNVLLYYKRFFIRLNTRR